MDRRFEFFDGSSTFPNDFNWLFPKWTCEINLMRLGNNPSGVSFHFKINCRDFSSSTAIKIKHTYIFPFCLHSLVVGLQARTNVIINQLSGLLVWFLRVMSCAVRRDAFTARCRLNWHRPCWLQEAEYYVNMLRGLRKYHKVRRVDSLFDGEKDFSVPHEMKRLRKWLEYVYNIMFIPCLSPSGSASPADPPSPSRICVFLLCLTTIKIFFFFFKCDPTCNCAAEH